MSRTILNSNGAIENNVEDQLIEMMKPEFNFIASNPVRACILHLLVKAEDLNHTMQVEEIAFRTGKRHSVVIYHLEQLTGWKLVEVVKNGRYGEKGRRNIWGLNLRYPNLINSIYSRILKFFYTQSELEKMCNSNKNVRTKR
jgi:DNA-binding transcriptional ArsR family regulator